MTLSTIDPSHSSSISFPGGTPIARGGWLILLVEKQKLCPSSRSIPCGPAPGAVNDFSVICQRESDGNSSLRTPN